MLRQDCLGSHRQRTGSRRADRTLSPRQQKNRLQAVMLLNRLDDQDLAYRADRADCVAVIFELF